jgi:putative tricarboxylic transport membrane protein
LGIILGDILDKNLRRALILSDGGILEFFTRPICAVIALMTLLTIVSRMAWFQSLVRGAREGIRSLFIKQSDPV